MKLYFPTSVFGPDTFADHYIFNCVETMSLNTRVNFGGGISAAGCRARRGTEPEAIRDRGENRDCPYFLEAAFRIAVLSRNRNTV
jgi:hypothetical protein